MILHLPDTGCTGDLFVQAGTVAQRHDTRERAPFEHVLVEDRQGGIRYWPDVVSPSVAQTWFDALRDGADWTAMRRPMYDRVVDVPRLLAGYKVHEFPASLPLQAILNRVHALAPAPYTHAGLNLYRDGSDSVAMHGDKLHSLAEGHPITLLSLGAPRRMLIREVSGRRDTIAIDLMPGSVLRMSHAAQTTHEHGIPKTRRSIGARMSVVFRVRPGTTALGGARHDGALVSTGPG